MAWSRTDLETTRIRVGVQMQISLFLQHGFGAPRRTGEYRGSPRIMSVTVPLVDNQDVRLRTDIVEPHPPGTIEVTVEGTVTITGALLGQFEATTLEPVAVEIAVDESETVTVDLRKDGRLRLETIDVGIEPPDTGDLVPDGAALESSVSSLSDSDPGLGSKPEPGVIAFTVEGVIEGVSPATIDDLTRSDQPLAVESITFAVEDSIRSDGGREDDIVAEFSLLGYGIVVRRNGTVTIGTRSGWIGESTSSP